MGAVPAPDEEPCRICDDMKDFLAKRGFKLPPPSSASPKSGGNVPAGDAEGAQHHDTIRGGTSAHNHNAAEGIVECPLDRATLGRYSWAMLHTMAAYYPTSPSSSDQTAMSEFMHRFSQFYPCATCAKHLRQDLVQHPPETASRHLFSQWMCQVHNRVNRRLGKPLFDCARVNQRWRTGPPC